MFSSLSHFPDNRPQMVNIETKPKTKRFAHARGWVHLPLEANQALLEHQKGWKSGKKGSPLDVATLGGIMGAKQTPNLIPLCHHIPIDGVDLTVEHIESLSKVQVDCRVSAFHHTGVEMEAIMGVSIACCTVYDMLKSASHGIEIESVCLIEKTGGRRDFLKEQA